MKIEINGIDGISDLLKGLGEGSAAKAQKILDIYSFDVLAALQLRSPVDSGRFKGAWQASKSSSPSSGAIASLLITNTMPYSAPLEEGSPLGGKPWPRSGPKTILYMGRVWSLQAIGGVAAPVIDDIAEGAAKALAEGLTK